ncbi:hypothetical protein B0H17DRAFT_1126142 [Mycena rosella]|uniref:Uncharacterized protein n=1 Tax=Mycena rosella TaxID=1033263 RepID=A0AAD7GTX1_MYCRO|nr:hypothetical protein B0H17DRAFT_1126142 [Mycena rosella]
MASPNRLPFIVHAAEWNEATNYKRIDSPTTVTFSGNPSAAQQAMMLSMFGPNAGTAIFNGAEMNIISGEITRTRSGTNIRFVDSDQPESEEAEGNDTNANTQDQEQYRSDGPGPDGNRAAFLTGTQSLPVAARKGCLTRCGVRKAMAETKATSRTTRHPERVRNASLFFVSEDPSAIYNVVQMGTYPPGRQPKGTISPKKLTSTLPKEFSRARRTKWDSAYRPPFQLLWLEVQYKHAALLLSLNVVKFLLLANGLLANGFLFSSTDIVVAIRPELFVRRSL